MTEEQIQVWKVKIAKYKEEYANLYLGKKPSEKLIQSFCSIHGIPWPLPQIEKPDVTDEWDFLK